MNTYKGDTTTAAISELRANSEAILNKLKENKVVLERRQRPVAVMLDYHKYEIMEKMLEFAEDYVLGTLAMERDKHARQDDFIELESW